MVIKLSKNSDQKNESSWRRHTTFRINIKETANFLSKPVQTRKQSSNYFKVQKIKTDSVELLTKQKYFSKMTAIYFFRHTKAKIIHH